MDQTRPLRFRIIRYLLKRKSLMNEQPRPALSCEVLVVGAGLAGLVAAIGFARAGFDTILCGEAEQLANGRTVALLESSIRLVKALDLWAGVEPRAAPLRALRLIDDTGGLWSAAPVEFRAAEIGLEAFGWNIENAELIDALAIAARASPGLRMVGSRVASYEFSADRAQARCENGALIAARLIAAADGRASPARNAARNDVTIERNPPTARTLILNQ
jgi:2-octaprenyl-6-methoxyphenol hydroxylase